MPLDRIRAQVDVRPPSRPVDTRDRAFTLRPKLRALNAALLRGATAPVRDPLFYMHADRQAEYREVLDSRVSRIEPDTVAELLAELWPVLVTDVDARQAARAIPGLHAAAARHPAARRLAELLHAIDDELVCVLEPARRTGYLMDVRGVVEVNQLHDLLATVSPGTRLFEAGDGVRFQVFHVRGLRQDGTLPSGVEGAGDWLFNEQLASDIPRRDGERVVLLGEALPTASRSEPRFPELRAEGQWIRALTVAEVDARLAKWTGASVPGAAVVCKAA